MKRYGVTIELSYTLSEDETTPTSPAEIGNAVEAYLNASSAIGGDDYRVHRVTHNGEKTTPILKDVPYPVMGPYPESRKSRKRQGNGKS